MASSSSSSSSSKHQWMYDVFINFRGEDTRDNFVSHLYAALKNTGVNAFLDDEELKRGFELKPELLQAIKGSRISLVVLSRNYADSRWCLDELEQIMECQRKFHRQMVIPIFYDVKPSNVRQRAKNVSEKDHVVLRWMNALKAVADLSGWDLSTFRSQAVAVKKIVDDVLTKLEDTFLSVAEFPVGLDPHVQEVVEFINNQSGKVCMVGIWGMGGLGKTTVAKAIYNHIHRQFEGTSFIENIREVCESDRTRGHMHLQQQLLSDVLKTKERIHSISMGTAMIEKRLKRKKALIILDDVTSFKQLKALCGNGKWFGQGSVILVTTRDVHLLKLLKVDYVYKMGEMDQKESLELFSWHAFGDLNPRKDLIKLSTNVVSYCGGLPLALEVLGSYLHGRTKKEWKSVLSKLERIPNDEVQEKLRISYDGLKDELHKDIFLDICFFFIGKDRAYVTEILNSCRLHADIGITILIERSLLKVEKNNKLGMHDLVRDMGREIVRESSKKDPGKRSRLWFHEDVHDILTKNTGTETVEGLVLKLQNASRIRFSADVFKEMKKLRLLQLDCVDLIGDYGHLSQELRWINWQGFTSTYIPDHFYQGNLVAIELKYSSIKQVWKETKFLEKLKFLNLSHSMYLENTPDFLKLPNLENLILKDCPSLREVHPSVGDLRKILLINLKGCTNLRNLPRQIYQLKSLKTLILSGCSKIDKLEEDIVQMESLTTLIAKDTAIKAVPYSIVKLKKIGYISLCGYEGLSSAVLPSVIQSWMSPTMNLLFRIPQFGSMPLPLVSNSGSLSSWLHSLSKLRSVWIQCHSEIQLTQESRRFLDNQYDVNYTRLITASEYASQISNVSLRSLLVRLGSCDAVMETLGMSILQGFTANDSSNLSLPCDNNPSWLGHKSEGPSVHFQVREDCDSCLKGIVLCVVYSSTHENLETECLTSVMIKNHTKLTIQIFKQDTVMSFNDEDWESVISNLDPGDNMEIVVAFGHGLTIKETAVYLIYGQAISMEIEFEPSVNVNMQPSPEVNLLPSPDVKMEESSTALNMQASPNLKVEPLPKPNKNFFTRLARRMGECSCLNKN